MRRMEMEGGRWSEVAEGWLAGGRERAGGRRWEATGPRVGRVISKLGGGLSVSFSGGLGGVAVVEVKDVVCADLDPALFADVVEVDLATRVRVAVGSVVDGAASEVVGLLGLHVPSEARVEDTVGKGGARADREALALEAGAVRVDVEEREARGVAASDHSTHGQTHALVVVDNVAEDLGGGADGDTFLVAELVEAALAAKLALPEHAVCGTAGHGAEQ